MYTFRGREKEKNVEPIDGIDLRGVVEAEKKAHLKETEAAVRRYVARLFRELNEKRMDLASTRAILADREAKVAEVEARIAKVSGGDWSGVQMGAYASMAKDKVGSPG